MGYAEGKIGIYWDIMGTYWDLNGGIDGIGNQPYPIWMCLTKPSFGNFR
jgi:hypothetical protein